MKKIYSILHLFGVCWLLMQSHSWAQSTDNVSFNNVLLESPYKKVYYAYLEVLVQKQMVQGVIEREYNPFTNENKRIVLDEDEIVAEVIYWFEEKNALLGVYRTYDDQYKAIFKNQFGENIVIERLLLGQEIKMIFYRDLDQYRIFFIQEYSENDANERHQNYWALALHREKGTVKYTQIKEWLEAPTPTLKSPIQTIYLSQVSFHDIDNYFYIFQQYSYPERKVTAYKFNAEIGKFLPD